MSPLMVLYLMWCQCCAGLPPAFLFSLPVHFVLCRRVAASHSAGAHGQILKMKTVFERPCKQGSEGKKRCGCLWPPSVDMLPGSRSRTCAWLTPDTALCRYLRKTEIHTVMVIGNGQCVCGGSPAQAGRCLFQLPATLVRTCMFSSRTARGSRYSAARPASTSASLLFTWLRRSRYSLHTCTALTMTKANFYQN